MLPLLGAKWSKWYGGYEGAARPEEGAWQGG
jgi:hypothetical protein